MIPGAQAREITVAIRMKRESPLPASGNQGNSAGHLGRHFGWFQSRSKYSTWNKTISPSISDRLAHGRGQVMLIAALPPNVDTSVWSADWKPTKFGECSPPANQLLRQSNFLGCTKIYVHSRHDTPQSRNIPSRRLCSANRTQ